MDYQKHYDKLIERARPKSEEHKRNITKGNQGKNKGRIPWNKGVPITEERRKNISESKKGKLWRPWTPAKRAAYEKRYKNEPIS